MSTASMSHVRVGDRIVATEGSMNFFYGRYCSNFKIIKSSGVVKNDFNSIEPQVFL